MHKWDVYPYYLFGLCYENMRHAPGWITEKLFDCMRANCIPIYWGAPNIADFVDPGMFIDRTQFKLNAELESFLMDMERATRTGIIRRLRSIFRVIELRSSYRQHLPIASFEYSGCRLG